jgi:PKD repeat protein
MKHFLPFLLLVVALGQTIKAQQTCATAPLISTGVTVVNSISGTQLPVLTCGPGGGNAEAANWYKYIPSQNYEVTVTTVLANNLDVDTRVQIFSGLCGNLTCVGGNDDFDFNPLCQVTFSVTANTSYYIVFDNMWSSNGFDFQLTEGQIIEPDSLSVNFIQTVNPNIIGSYKSATVDMNGDYLDDIVSVSSNSINLLLQDTSGNFSAQNIATTTAQFLPSWSLAAGDINEDGYNDLLYGGGNGVTFMKSNGLGTGYTQMSGSQYVFSQRSNFVDINNDGHLDAFVCHDVAPNVFYINDGNGNLNFNQGGMGNHPNGGNYGSIWVDYNNDHLPDLFIAKCRGGAGTAKINELHRNNGDGTFTDVSSASNLADPIQTWSSAWNDFDNDGWMDVVVGASATSDGSHKFMHNNGDGTFSNITAGSGLDTYSGLSIEYVSYDFNNDGFTDVLTNGIMLYNIGNNKFSVSSVPMQVGAVADLNNDGFLDVQNSNSIFYNQGNENNWLTVTVKGTTSNINGIGARIEIYGAWGKQIRDVRSGVGFRFMGTLNSHFGIGAATEIDSVIVRWPSGNIDLVCNPQINTVLHIIENTGLEPVSAFTSTSEQNNDSLVVSLTDNSSNCPSSWLWSVAPYTGWEFSNGTNANSQNPIITFSSAGTYYISLETSNLNGNNSNPAIDTVSIISTVGLSQIVNSNTIIYPNPVEDILFINSNTNATNSVRIISILGNEIELNLRNNKSVDVSNLQTGIYTLLFKDVSGKNISTRFVKK